MLKKNPSTIIDYNKRAHDTIASSYERSHPEIYNPTEQARIAGVLAEAIYQIRSLPGTSVPLVLDFGSGSGNLTRHLLRLGTKVVAADVSLKSLLSIKEAFTETSRFEIAELNGTDLSNFQDRSFDLVATYSVLHHIPDYLGIIKEFVRVLKPGGVIYIDHEFCPGYWLDSSDEYKAYWKELYGQPFMGRLIRKFYNLFSYNAWKCLLNIKLYGLSSEGDIHIFKDDHIEWPRIEELLLQQCVLLKREDYLLCREVNPIPPLYEKYRAKIADMRVVICRKAD